MSARDAAGRGGFSLIELMVAMVLTSVALMALAPALFQSVNRQKIDTVGMERDAVLLAEANRMTSLPFPQLDAQAGCTTIPAEETFPHERCIAVETVGARERKVVVRVTPLDTAVRPDSVQVFRTTPPPNPFNSE